MKLAGFEAIVRALNGTEVRYLLVGGLAVNAHGYGRNTFSVDIVIQLNPQNIQNAFEALRSADYHPHGSISASVWKRGALGKLAQGEEHARAKVLERHPPRNAGRCLRVRAL